MASKTVQPRRADPRSPPAREATTGGSLPANGGDAVAREARRRLVRAAGEFAREFGFGRVLGELLMHLYLTEGAAPLDAIESDLRLSKAAVSIAARRLELLGLIVREPRAGDRRRYYRTADHLGEALRLGLLTLLRRRLEAVRAELDAAADLLGTSGPADRHPERQFLMRRIRRAAALEARFALLLRNPLAQLLLKLK